MIDGGRILESGNHRELIAQRGRYYDLYTNQFTHEKATEIMEHHEEID